MAAGAHPFPELPERVGEALVLSDDGGIDEEREMRSFERDVDSDDARGDGYEDPTSWRRGHASD